MSAGGAWMLSSRSDAWGEWKGTSIAAARLASREADVVAAVARADVSADPLLPDEIRAFVIERVGAEQDRWKSGDTASIAALFPTAFPLPEGRYRIVPRRDPLARLVWAGYAAAEESWRVVVRVWVQLVRFGRRWWRFEDNYTLESAYWTLLRRDQDWSVERVEGDADGLHYLRDPLPDHGLDQSLRDAATISTATEDAAPATTSVAELTDVDASTRSQLLDLSVVDSRYAPDVIAACAQEIARAWESATFSGDQALLDRWCTPAAAAQLFHPTPHGRRRVQNLEPRRIEINAFDPGSEPPTVRLTFRLYGRRWLATSTGGKISGSRWRGREFTEHWTLSLDPSPDSPWRLTDVRDPARR